MVQQHVQNKFSKELCPNDDVQDDDAKKCIDVSPNEGAQDVEDVGDLHDCIEIVRGEVSEKMSTSH